MKQIIFCRCSTDKQEVESQLLETKQYAISLGYNEKDFIYISSVGASAVKLNELYMQTLQQLKNYILSGEINAVICFHLNRLCRNDIIAMELKELFISNRVQLHIKEPTISLLNVDGSVNSGAELCFSLFATMNKQNAIELKAKTLRGKNHKASQGLYIGGGVPLGYKVDNDIIVIDEEKRFVVELMFQLFLEGYSSRKIITELIERRLVDSITQAGVLRVLKNKKYYDGTLPPIINKDTFDKVQVLISNKNTVKGNKHYFFCATKIKCDCGFSYMYSLNDNNYLCHHNKRILNKNIKHNPSVLIPIIDGIVFSLVKERVEKEQKKNQEKNRKDLVIKIDSLLQKSLKYATDIHNFQSKYNKLNDMYLEDFISKSDFEIKRKQLQIKENELKEKEYKNKLELDRLTNIFADKSEYSVFDTNNSIEVQRVIQQHIHLIKVHHNFRVVITFTDNSVFEFYYYGRYKHKIYADKEHLQPLYFPTIEHHNDTFVLNEKYNPISKNKG